MSNAVVQQLEISEQNSALLPLETSENRGDHWAGNVLVALLREPENEFAKTGELSAKIEELLMGNIDFSTPADLVFAEALLVHLT